MPTGSGLRFRLAGFAVSVPLNTLLGVALIAWLWLPSFAHASPARQWASALTFAVLLLGSVLVHELAHAAAARKFGFPVVGITLWAFGGYTSYRPIRNTPAREALIAVSGPAATLALAVVIWGVLRQTGDTTSMLADLLGALTLANILVGAFNLLPGLPLDGGSVVSAGVWALTGSRHGGQRVAAYSGMVLAGLIVAAPFWLSLRTGASADLGLVIVSVLIAAFLFLGARGALRGADASEQLAGRTAGELAVRAIIVPSNATLADLDRMLASAPDADAAVALVGDPANGLQGYVLPAAAAAVPRTVRTSTAIASVTKTVPNWGWMPAAAPAEEAFAIVIESGAPVVVTDPSGRPTGVIVTIPSGGA